MKNILTLLTFVFAFTIANGQYSPGIEKIVEQDLKILEDQITLKYPNLAFSPTQKIQIAAVLKERAKEIHALKIQKNVSKYDYTTQHSEIVVKYNDKLKQVLSEEQKAVHFKESSPVTKPRAND